jgi:hypothetical protein
LRANAVPARLTLQQKRLNGVQVLPGGEVSAAALACERIAQIAQVRPPRRVIVVKDKPVNFIF